MPTLRSPLFAVWPAALAAVAAPARAQAQDANQGPFAATPGVLLVDAATGIPDRLLHKPPGYFATFPDERTPAAGEVEFRAQAMFAAQLYPPSGPLAIDAFSLGMDWIVSDNYGETRGPEGRFAVLLFSVTRDTQGEAGFAVANEAGNGGDGAAGDLFCYEFTRSPTPGVPQDLVTRAFDSTDVNIQPAAGTANITGFDWFAWTFSSPEFQAKLPPKVTAYFSVTTATALSVPLQWCGNQPSLRSGATIFQTTWRPGGTPGGGSWSTPRVYLAPQALNLAAGDDVDALAVDTAHHASHYVLFSIADPPAGTDRLRFHNRGNGHVGAYRYANGGPKVEDRLRIGRGDVDAVCLIDPGADELVADVVGQPVAAPPGLPAPGPVTATCYRAFGTDDVLVFGASNSAGAHAIYAYDPDLAGAPLIGPVASPRDPTHKGSPSLSAMAMNVANVVRRIAYGIVQAGAATSSFVALREWADRIRTVTAPAMFAAVESGGGMTTAWPAGETHIQCFFGATNFTSQGLGHPIVIETVEWRQDGDLAGAAVHYPNVDVYLGYAATSHLAPVSTFAGNRSPGHTLVFSGPVEVKPAFEARPNRYTILVPLQTLFPFDPGRGQDLLLEVVIHAAPTPAVASIMDASYIPALSAASSVRSPIAAATTGAFSSLCPVVRFGHRDAPGAATTTAYGTGCYDRAVSFHQTFAGGGFDLAGAPVHSVLMVPTSDGWMVLPGSNGWRAPTVAGLGLGDDQAATFALPSTFTFPGGSTTALRICSNGFITLNGTSTNVSYTPPASALLAGEPRLCPCWADLLPDGATNVANVYAEHDPATNTVYVTWLAVPTYTPVGAVTMQVAIDLTTMSVEYRWQGCTLPTSALVGWSPGGGARDPGDRDLTDLPFATAADQAPLALSAPSRAVTGSTVSYTVSAIPPTALFSAVLMSLGGVDPGYDLGFLGMPGCRAYVALSLASTFLLFGGPVVASTFAIPNDPSLVGLPIDTQAAAFVPGANALGAVASNGLLTTVGSL